MNQDTYEDFLMYQESLGMTFDITWGIHPADERGWSTLLQVTPHENTKHPPDIIKKQGS